MIKIVMKIVLLILLREGVQKKGPLSKSFLLRVPKIIMIIMIIIRIRMIMIVMMIRTLLGRTQAGEQPLRSGLAGGSDKTIAQ